MHDALWAPWRLQYLQHLDRDAREGGAGLEDFLSHCWHAPQDDLASHVIYRDDHGLIMLNRYPYANGHLLVALGDARPTLLEYDGEQRTTFWTLVERALNMMQQTLDPQGVNLGINEGEAAGAGLPGHLHAHLVPRWHGDVNFMTTTAGARVIPSTLDDMAQRFRDGAV